MYNPNNDTPETLPWWSVYATEGLAVYIPGFKTNLDPINAPAMTLTNSQDFCYCWLKGRHDIDLFCFSHMLFPLLIGQYVDSFPTEVLCAHPPLMTLA